MPEMVGTWACGEGQFGMHACIAIHPTKHFTNYKIAFRCTGWFTIHSLLTSVLRTSSWTDIGPSRILKVGSNFLVSNKVGEITSVGEFRVHQLWNFIGEVKAWSFENVCLGYCPYKIELEDSSFCIKAYLLSVHLKLEIGESPLEAFYINGEKFFGHCKKLNFTTSRSSSWSRVYSTACSKDKGIPGTF